MAALDPQTALEIVEKRLGRTLTPQELTDLQTVLAGGITAAQLKSEPINSAADGQALFPKFAVSARPLVGQPAPPSAAVPAAPAAPPTRTAMFDPAGYSAPSAPEPEYDPFGLGDFGETTFEAAPPTTQTTTTPETPFGQANRYEREAGSDDILTRPATTTSTTKTYSAVVARFYGEFVNWSDKKIRGFQRALEKAGYLAPGQYRPGFADQQTLSGLGEAIEDSQRRGQDLPATLQDAIVAVKRAERRAERQQAREDKQSFQEMAEDRYKNELLASYMTDWGKPPPPGYIDTIAAQGWNLYEFRAHERAKDAWTTSPRYHEERLSLEQDLAQTFGALG